MQGWRPAPHAQEGMCHRAQLSALRHPPPPTFKMQPSYQYNSGCRNQALAMIWMLTLILEMAHKINVLMQGHLQVTEVWLRQGQLCRVGQLPMTQVREALRLLSFSVLLNSQGSFIVLLLCLTSDTGPTDTQAAVPHHNAARGPGQWKGHHSCS